MNSPDQEILNSEQEEPEKTDLLLGRKILHVDMDAFYASVEIKDNPKLEGLPVVVGGSPNSRGVVAAASYKAREYGIRSAMACSVAKRLCPSTIFVPPRFSRYQEISQQVHQVFQEYTLILEPLSIDEAWLDVTQNLKDIPSATWIAQAIKDQVKKETGLTCSAGVSFNKFLAKIASDEDKPDGLFVITPKNAFNFLQNMEVKKIPGVGKVTQANLASMGIIKGHQLYEKSEGFLTQQFGKMGRHLYSIIRGIDLRPVAMNHERKSISVENTYSQDYLYGEELLKKLESLSEQLLSRLDSRSITGKTLNLKVKFFDFKVITRNMSQSTPFITKEEIFAGARHKLEELCTKGYPKKKIRLLGIGISNFVSPEEEKENTQLDFFDLL